MDRAPDFESVDVSSILAGGAVPFIINGSPIHHKFPRYAFNCREVLIMDEETLGLVRLLLARLERISADSFWAHRASGVRGSLARMMDHVENGGQVPESDLKHTIELGFKILERAAREKVS